MQGGRDVGATRPAPVRVAMIGQKGLPATIGGIERHVEEVGRRLADRGHNVVVYCRGSYGEGQDRAYLGMRLVRAPTIGTKHLDAIVHSASSTLMAMVGRADVVHYHALGPGLCTPLPRFLSSSKVVLTVHGLDHEREKWGAGARAVLGGAYWISGRVPHQTIVVSKYLADHYAAEFTRPVEHIGNGVAAPDRIFDTAPLAAFGLRPRSYTLFVGRLVPEKQPHLLIDAFRRGAGPDEQLAIVGSSSLKDDFGRNLAMRASGDPRIVFTGFAGGDTLAALYQHARVFVQPSDLEGLPLTLLEAIAHGCPVVASDIPPHLEVLQEGSAIHRFFRQGDAAHLDAVLRGVSSLGASGWNHPLRDRVLKDFSWESVTDRIEATYQQVLGPRGTGPPPGGSRKRR